MLDFIPWGPGYEILTTQVSYILKEHTELYKILKFLVNWANIEQDTAIQKLKNGLRDTCPEMSWKSGAIIWGGDRKRAISSIGVGPKILNNFSIFRTNCTTACGRRAYIAARIFADVSQGKWLQLNSTPLWLLEFSSSIFPVSCSSLSEDGAEFRYVPLYIADQVEFRCSFYWRTSHYFNLNFTYEED